MKKLSKQVLFYVGIACLAAAVAMAVLQSMTVQSNSLLSAYAAGMNNNDYKKLASVATPQTAAYMESLAELGNLAGGLNDALNSLGVNAGAMAQMMPEYRYMPARIFINENGGKYLYYFMVPVNGADTDISYNKIRIEKVEGKEYLDF